MGDTRLCIIIFPGVPLKGYIRATIRAMMKMYYRGLNNNHLYHFGWVPCCKYSIKGTKVLF